MNAKKKVLLVDDSNTMLLMEQMMLKGEYACVTARDGEEALEKALSERPDLILMDVVMPRKTGFEVCRDLRLNAETRSIPVILCTTRGEEVNREEGRRTGCNAYVTKPLNKHELISQIRACLFPRGLETDLVSI